MKTFFPKRIEIESVPILAFASVQDLFGRILAELDKPKQITIYGHNVHAANLAHQRPDWREIIARGDVVYCDGAGIVWGAKLHGKKFPTRLTAADWMIDFVRFLAQNNKTAYFLAGEPSVPERALQLFDKAVPGHTVVGAHHGYILDNPELEDAVIAEINSLKPDVLLVGFGMPIQEYWMERVRERLDVKAVWAIGATLDYLTGKVPRCPGWMGQFGYEWLFRFLVEPKRMFGRYIMGNPWFLSRMALSAVQKRLLSRPAKRRRLTPAR